MVYCPTFHNLEAHVFGGVYIEIGPEFMINLFQEIVVVVDDDFLRMGLCMVSAAVGEQLLHLKSN